MIGAIISAIVVGAIIGVLARLVMPGRQNLSVLMTVALGTVGGLLGSWITGAVVGSTGWFLPFIIGVVVAIVLIGLYTGFAGRRGTPVGH